MSQPYTRIANSLWDSGTLRGLSSSARWLLMVLARHTTGRGREWVIMGETKLLEETGLCRTDFYAAKRELAGHLIEIEKTPQGVCRYRIADRFQVDGGPGNDDTRSPERTPIQNNGRVQNSAPPSAPANGFAILDPVRQGGLYPSAIADVTRSPERTLNKEHLKERSKETTTTEISLCGSDDVVENSISFPSETVTPNQPSGNGGPRSAAEGKVPAAAALTAEQSALSAELRLGGVSSDVATRLARSKSAELIRKALARVAATVPPPGNPAGAVVAEIERGGYEEPPPAEPWRPMLLAAVVPMLAGTAVPMPEHEAIAARRRVERDEDERRRQEEDERGQAEWTATWSGLAPECRSSLLARARQENPKFADLPDDSVLIRVAVRELHGRRQPARASPLEQAKSRCS